MGLSADHTEFGQRQQLSASDRVFFSQIHKIKCTFGAACTNQPTGDSNVGGAVAKTPIHLRLICIQLSWVQANTLHLDVGCLDLVAERQRTYALDGHQSR